MILHLKNLIITERIYSEQIKENMYEDYFVGGFKRYEGFI